MTQAPEERQWHGFYAALVDYKVQFRNCNVPVDYVHTVLTKRTAMGMGMSEEEEEENDEEVGVLCAMCCVLGDHI
jgi:hypothetical protein